MHKKFYNIIFVFVLFFAAFSPTPKQTKINPRTVESVITVAEKSTETFFCMNKQTINYDVEILNRPLDTLPSFCFDFIAQFKNIVSQHTNLINFELKPKRRDFLEKIFLRLWYTLY